MARWAFLAAPFRRGTARGHPLDNPAVRSVKACRGSIPKDNADQIMIAHRFMTRRAFLGAGALVTAGAAFDVKADPDAEDAIIDIHQHTHYSGRTNQQLLAHQRAMGIAITILLPAGRPVNRPSTHDGKSNGLAAECGGNDTVVAMAREHPGEYRFFANEVPDLPEARTEIEKYLGLGGLGIGEQKFNLPCDSPSIQNLAALAQEHGVPVLLHFQHGAYNLEFGRFHKILEQFPKVNFIGHAQTWWGNIDKNHDQAVMYPKGKVTPGGITDRLLSDYPNMFGDLSAGSGLNALLRDEAHTRGFLERHQNKLLYGSDCSDTIGRGLGCQGAQTIATVRRLAPSREIERKLLYGNAKRLLKLQFGVGRTATPNVKQ
jgi:predicted TIM-barrel fold metal-dependent hydrolase